MPAAPVVILEGVTAGRAAGRDRLTYLVWIETSLEARRARGLERDGPRQRSQWERWMAEEEGFYATDPIRAHADLIVDGDPAAPHDPEREFAGLG